MGYDSLPSHLWNLRKNQELSMLDVAIRMHELEPIRKISTYNGYITFFEKGWAELRCALEGQQPWKKYLDICLDALQLSETNRATIDLHIKNPIEEILSRR